MALKPGSVSFGQRELGYFKNYGDQPPAVTPARPAEVSIGTIAPDLFQNRVLLIDYPHQRLCVAEELPAEFAQATFQPFKLKDGRLRIPLRIGGAPQDLLFDTGASLFALLTTKSRAAALSVGTIQDSIETSTWGHHYYVYGRRPKTPIHFGSKQLAPALVFYDNLHKSDEFYAQEQVWGITGNAYFLHNIVIIDYRKRLFGVQ